MSITAIKATLERSRAKGATRLVLVILADAVNHAKLERGQPWEAWPSQGTIAKQAGLSDRAVRRHLATLLTLGEIREVGRKGRGCVVYEISLPDVRTEASRVDGSVQGESQVSLDPGRERPGGRTNLEAPWTEASGPPWTEASAEPEGEPEANCNRNRTESPADAGDLHSPLTAKEEEKRPEVHVLPLSPTSTTESFDQERVELLRRLRDDQDPEERERDLQRLGELNGDEIVMDMWARRLPMLLREEAVVA